MDAIRKQHIETLRNVGDHIEYNEEYGGIYYTSDFVRTIEYVLELLEGPKRVTNADRIRGMSDEELAQFMCRTFMCQINNCPGAELCTPNDGKANGILKWLRQPVQPTPDIPDAHEHSGLFGEE